MRRRTFVIRAAAAACLSPLGSAMGCTDPEGETTSEGEAGEGSTSGSTTRDASSDNGAASSNGTASSGSGPASTSGPTSSTGSSSAGSGSESTTVQLDSGTSPPFTCNLTPEDIEGPFYRPRIPAGGDLNVHKDPGTPLLLEGRVLDEDCQPIESAVVEIWHATPVSPGGMPGDAEAEYDDTAAYRYYGQVTTDAMGSYAFVTLRPGWYLNGPEYRPAHVHLKVWVEGVERLTTQIYFEGDPFNEGDTWFNEDMAIAPDADGLAVIDIIV